jgi:transcriptional regulator with XRE-family HTH domain
MQFALSSVMPMAYAEPNNRTTCRTQRRRVRQAERWEALMNTPAEMIAAALLRERRKAGKSLSALAAEAGIAKSTLSQIEAGSGNPSVETLWALATALGIPFSFLFEVTDPQVTLIRADEGEAVAAENAPHAAVLLSACGPGRRRDLYRIRMQPGAPRHADPHPEGTLEHAVLISGRMRLGPAEATEVLDPGDYFVFRGDRPHLYEALAPDTLLLLAMEAP